jgi:hypothetical protein
MTSNLVMKRTLQSAKALPVDTPTARKPSIYAAFRAVHGNTYLINRSPWGRQIICEVHRMW